MKKLTKLLIMPLALLLAAEAGAATVKSRFTDGVLRFDYKAEDLFPAEERGRARLEKSLAAIIAIPKEQRTWDNTVMAYERAFEDYSEEFDMAFFLAEVSEDKTLRDAATDLEQKVSEYLIEVATRRELYQAFKEYSEVKPRLAAAEERLFTKVMDGFKKSGLTLPDAELAAYRELNKRQSMIGIEFSKTLRENKDFIEVTKEELAGMDDNYINRLEKTEDGKYKITMDYPDYVPFMSNAKSDGARQALEFKYNNRGGQENVDRLEETLRIRQEKANMLGYKNFGAFQLEDRMAKKPSNVTTFLNGLERKLQPLRKNEDKTLLAYKQSKTGQAAKEFRQWDYTYWVTQYKKEFYDVDHEKIKEYFPAEYVLDQMLVIFGDLFGARFDRADIPVWHKDVRAFKVTNKDDGKLVAYFYMDLFPRDGKYKHAACFGLEKGHVKQDGSYQVPFAAVVANFNPPSKDAPSLLKHSEVETLFHEFGHVTHQIFTTAKYSALSGTSVARDFVEVPSQLLENWAWNPEMLKKFSKHYKTGDVLPDDVINKMLKAKNFGNGGYYLRQGFFASYDMHLHTRTKYADTTKVYFDLAEKIRKMKTTPGTLPQASFGHIMSGYAAGYYGYLWAEVMAQDFFSVFEKEGINNPAVGKRYRDTVLAVGGTYDEEETVKKFLGRPQSDKAFLNGLFPDKK